MESCVNFIRVRVDLRDVNLPFVKQAWVSIDRSVQRTVKDFKLSLYPKFKLSEDRNVSLYLQECLLPDEEPIFVLRDDDVIRVVYENLPSLLDSQCNDYMGFASTSRHSVKRITDGSCNVSFYTAKKAKVSSPVLITESFHDISDAQTSVSDTMCLADISAEMNTDVSKTESVKKKRKKRKKCLKEGNRKYSIEHSHHLENELNNSVSEVQKISGPPSDELGSQIKITEDHLDENLIHELLNPKEHKGKERKHSDKNVTELSEQINDIYSLLENSTDCADAKKNEYADVLSRNISQSNGDVNGSVSGKAQANELKVNEKEIRNKVQLETGVCVISDGSENCIEVQKLQGKSSDVSNVESRYATEVVNDVTGGNVSLKTECKGQDVKNTSLHEVSKSVLPTLVCSDRKSTFLGFSPANRIKMEGDCIQSLGNNCPKKKKKRTRRGKRKSRELSVPFSNMNNDCSSSVLPLSTQPVVELASDFIHGVRNERNGRKHIRFTESLGSNHTTMSSDNVSSGTIVNPAISVAVEGSHSSQELLKTKVSSQEIIQDKKDAETVAPYTSPHQKELVFRAVRNDFPDGTGNKDNVQETSEGTLKANKKSFEGFPPLTRFPVVGDVIAFKRLELTDSYCPEISDYKEGKIVNVYSDDVLEIDLVEEQVIPVRDGKFENVYPDEEVKPQVIKKVCVQWSAMIEPKIISSEYDGKIVY